MASRQMRSSAHSQANGAALPYSMSAGRLSGRSLASNISVPGGSSNIVEHLFYNIRTNKKVHKVQYIPEDISASFRKKLLKKKDSLFRSRRLEVGFICVATS